jgi:hypothetical protein
MTYLKGVGYVSLYRLGYLHCGSCGEYVKRKDAHRGTKPGDGHLYHNDCGLQLKGVVQGERSRLSGPEARRPSEKHRRRYYAAHSKEQREIERKEAADFLSHLRPDQMRLWAILHGEVDLD